MEAGDGEYREQDAVTVCTQQEDQTMHRTLSSICLAGLGLVALLATASIARAETVQLKADLKGSNAAAKGDAAVTTRRASR